MIYETLKFLCEELNAYLRKKFGLAEDTVMLSSLKNADGTSSVANENKVVLTLINVEEDAVSRNLPMNKALGTVTAPAVNISFQVLVSTTFSPDNYPESLKFLYEVIAFFRNNNVFTQQTSPKLNANVEKLVVAMRTRTIQENTALWQMLGSYYTPSVVYEVRVAASSSQP